MAKPLPSVEMLREMFAYDPESGLLVWRIKPSRKHHAGREAATISKGYKTVRFGGENYQVHRIVWKLMTGREPPEIDHENRDRCDNRWKNLRAADSSLNKINRACPNPHRGVHYIKRIDRWGAQIKRDKKHEWLGCYRTAEEACAVYQRRAAELHGEFAPGRTCACR